MDLLNIHEMMKIGNMSYVHRQWQDEPATTSEITYKLQVQSRFGHNAIFNDFGESSMCILEVQG